MNMARIVILLILALFSFYIVYAHETDQYVREAEYYQKKADGYRREATFYLKKAEQYERDALYYTKKGKTDTAKCYQRKAKRAMDNYKAQLRYASNADQKAADNLKRAARDYLNDNQYQIHSTTVILYQ